MKLINNDFRKILHHENFDFIITDPPYNINFKYNEYNDNLSEEEYIEMLSELQGYKMAIIHYPEETMKYIVPALGVPDEVIVWCYNSNLPRQSRLINFYNCKPDFNKVKQPYKNPDDKRIKKLIENGSKGTRIYDWFSDIQLVKNVSKEKNHPCPIPEKLIERIILLISKEEDTICDPFAGSMTTGVAGLKNKRDIIMIEKDKFYFDKGVERINEIL